MEKLIKYLSLFFLILILFAGIGFGIFFFLDNTNQKVAIEHNRQNDNILPTVVDCEEMNGWWGILDNLYDMTITAPNVNYGSYEGTIEKYNDDRNRNSDFTRKYLITFKLEKDGYIRTEKWYICEPSVADNYAYYVEFENREDVLFPMWKKND